jgi:hypothetical protein
MLSKRVIVIAADRPFQKRLIAGAMAAGGAVQAFANSEELPGRIEADLVLYAMGWQIADPAFNGLLARLPEGARLVPILPAPQLEGMVQLLCDPRISSVLVADEISAQTISSTVSKLLYGDLFGLEKVMPWGVRVYSMLVGDYQEKSQAISTIGDFGSAMGVRRKYREQIDQCIDEMLMNALYDAPVDDDGKPMFADVPVKERVGLRVEQRAVVQYACDGDRFAVSVRDGFGSLRKTTVLQYLDKCLHSAGPEQIDRKAGGAGLGLYLIANAATEVYFHIFDGSATEVVCTFDLQASRSQLRSFGIFEENLETASRPVPGQSGIRTLPTRKGRRREDIAPAPQRSQGPMLAMMATSMLVLLVALALAAMPYLKKQPKAALRVESDPPGATVFLDGRTRGQAPLVIADLEAGRSYAVRSTLAGHKDDDQLVVAAEGESAVRLHLAHLAASVHVESEPAGARVLVDGSDSGRLSPTTLELEPGKQAKLTLHKDGFLEQTLEVTAPKPGETTTYRTSLPLSRDVAGLTIEVAPTSATVFVDGMALMPPGQASYDTFVKPGQMHHLKVTANGFVDFRHDLTLTGGEHRTIDAKLGEGGVLALKVNVTARVLVDDKAVGTTPLAPTSLSAGKHTLTLIAAHPYLRYATSVQIEKGKTLEQKIDFGTVEVKAPGVTAHVAGTEQGLTLLELPAGPQKLALSNGTEKKEHDVVVPPSGRVVIDSW